jgi:hypothetical protein
MDKNLLFPDLKRVLLVVVGQKSVDDHINEKQAIDNRINYKPGDCVGVNKCYRKGGHKSCIEQ